MTEEISCMWSMSPLCPSFGVKTPVMVVSLFSHISIFFCYPLDSLSVSYGLISSGRFFFSLCRLLLLLDALLSNCLGSSIILKSFSSTLPLLVVFWHKAEPNTKQSLTVVLPLSKESLVHQVPMVSVHDGCFSHTSSETAIYTSEGRDSAVFHSSVPQILHTEADKPERPVRWDNCALTVTLPLSLSAHLSICPSFLPISLPGSFAHTCAHTPAVIPPWPLSGNYRIFFSEQLLYLYVRRMKKKRKKMPSLTFWIIIGTMWILSSFSVS